MKTRIYRFIGAIVVITMTLFAPRAHAALYDVVNVSALTNTFECSLVATQLTVLINGTNVHAMCYVDKSPGGYVPVAADGIPIPRINVNVGEKLICHFTNNISPSVGPEGASIHWHGLELDNDSDGTGVTQDTILPGQNYVYQFNTFRPGVYWFHSHMVPGNATFAGMYGALIIPNTNETALVTSGVLPDPTNTYTLVMSDIDFNPTNGLVQRQIKTKTETNWYTLNDIVLKCHLYDTGQPGGEGDACGWAALPGKTVLVNGQAPTTNSPTQTPMYTVLAGQRVRLNLLNDSISRDFRLRLLNNGSGATTNLYRIGGQGGLLNNVRVEGGIQGTWDTKYSKGEIDIGSGMRSDVIFYPTGASNSIITLVGNPLPAPFMFSGSTFNINQTSANIPNIPSNYPVAYFKIVGTASPAEAVPAAGDAILSGPTAVQSLASLATNTLLALGDCNDPTIHLTGNPTPTNAFPTFTQPSPSIDNFAGLLDGNTGNGDFTNVPVVSTARYAYVGDVLELSIANSTTPGHPFHLHGFSMQPLRLIANSNSSTIYNFNYNEYVDTINVYGQQTLVFRVRLDDRAQICDLAPDSTPGNGPQLKACTAGPSGGAIGRWLYHCHIFAHAGQGMMGELDVRKKRFRVFNPVLVLSSIYIKLHPGDPVEQVILKGECEWQAAVDETGHGVSTGRDGLDFVNTEMTVLRLTGQTSRGLPITMTLDSAQLSTGQIQELQNLTAGALDVAPFTRSGSATSSFDIFANVNIAGTDYHLASPMHLTGNFSSLPPAPTELLGDSTGTSIALLDLNGRDAGIEITPQQLGLNPPPNPVPDAPLCPSNMTAYATSSSGALVNYTVPELFGDCPFGHQLTSTPPSGSTFPIGTSTVTCTATDDCGLSNTCSFSVTVLDPSIFQVVDWFFVQNSLRPTASQFAALLDSAITYPDDRYLLGLKLYDCSDGIHPPVLGSPAQSDTFTCSVNLQMSDALSSQQFQATAVGLVKWEKIDNTDNVSAEMLSLDIAGGTLPAGTMLRESPTLQSIGQTTVRPVKGGYLISGFFDVFTELSLDGGQTWSPAGKQIHLELFKRDQREPAVSEPSPLLNAPLERYDWPGGYAQHFDGVQQGGGTTGSVILSNFTYHVLDAAVTSNSDGTVSIDNVARVNVLVSLDGGSSYQTVSLKGNPHNVTKSQVGLGDVENLTAELTDFTTSGQDVGPAIMVRESPTLPSRGKTEITPQADGSYRIGSFFDVFPEISLDGGQTWTAANEGAGHLMLQPFAPEGPAATPNLPPLGGRFRSGVGYWKFSCDRFASGVVLSNIALQNFDDSVALLPPADPQTNILNCQATGLMSIDGGQTFEPFHGSSHIKYFWDKHVLSDDPFTSVVKFHEIEILQLDIAGGNLPTGVTFRESPSKSSPGRTSIRAMATADGGNIYEIASFFDIFPEMSADGGQTWSATTSDPMTLILTAPDCPAISLSPFALPYGQTSTTYNQQIRAAGGLAPYTFALTSGALPDGLSLSSDGILLGTPTTTGSSTFSITATDFTGCAGIQPYTVRVTGGCTDINPPTVTLTNPKNNSPVTTATITAQGIATDNVSVDQLLVGLDSDPLQKATLVYGATHKSAVWSASLTATPGQHRIIVVGVDSCGNNTTIVKSFFEVSPTPMVLTLNGYGSVTGPARLSVGANQLNIGQTYTFNAVPSPNNLFSNLIIYQDDVPNIVTNPKRVSFTMGSNTAITLNFVTNWFIDAAGKYAGLYDTGGSSINHSDSGSIGFNVTKGQTFSGALYRHGQKLGFAGKFDLDGNGMLTRTAGTTTPTDILVSHNGQITCTVTGDSMASAGATAYKAAFSAPNPCPLGGFNYTFILPGAVGLPTVPAGDGYATIKIASNGVATFTGKYADGAALSMSAPLSLDLKLPFYQALYQQPGTTPATFAGSAIGWLSLDSPPSLVRTSNITWSHGAFAGIPYAAGFTNPIAATAWLYVRPLTGLPSIAVPNMGIVLQDGGLSSAIVITDAKYVGTPPKITIPMASNPYKLTLSIAPQTGLMTGHFVPISGQPAVNIFGAVMQSDNSATGFFLGTDSTGAKFSGYSTAQDQLKANPRH